MESSLSSQMSPGILIAHPSLKDPNFEKSVILLSAYSANDGAVGVILNRPSNRTIGQWTDDFAFTALERVPVYHGGPVQHDQLILAALDWGAGPNTFRFRFGLSIEEAMGILDRDEQIEVRGFMGYAGWTGGQLESEIRQRAWVAMSVNPSILSQYEPETMWQSCIRMLNPGPVGLLDFPDDPALN